jgi:hypothetical protein
MCGGSPPLGENVVADGNNCRIRESGVCPPAIANATLPATSDSMMTRRFMGNEIIRDTLAFLLILGAAAGAQAQTAAEPPNPLAQIKALKCQFPSATSAVWKEGAPQAQTKMQDMRFEINAIDVGDGTAEFMGTAGRAYVTAVLSGWSLYFVESAVGQLNVTTVFSQEASPKKLKAVHSRHGYLEMKVGRFVAEPSVSQNYGECEVVQ